MRTLPLTTVLIAALATGTASATPPPPPQPVAGFHTKTIECIVYEWLYDGAKELDCSVNARGRAVSMMSRGHAERLTRAEPVGEPTYGSLLRVGKSWRFGRTALHLHRLRHARLGGGRGLGADQRLSGPASRALVP